MVLNGRHGDAARPAPPPGYAEEKDVSTSSTLTSVCFSYEAGRQTIECLAAEEQAADTLCTDMRNQYDDRIPVCKSATDGVLFQAPRTVWPVGHS